MRLVFKLLTTTLLLPMASTVLAASHADLDRRLQLLKSDFVTLSQQAPVRSSQDRMLLGFTEKTSLSLQSITLSLNGQQLLKHDYEESENRSLREGGMQPLLDVKLPLGKSQMLVQYKGRTPDGQSFEQTSKFTISKSNTKKIIELTLSNKANSAPRLGIRAN